MSSSAARNPYDQNRFLRRRQRTNPLVWLAAILSSVLAIAVILTGIFVFAVYMIYQPKIPYLEVKYAHLERLSYDQSGLLDILMTLTVVADNDNIKAHASFSDISLDLRFRREKIAELRADPFDVAKNSTNVLPYLVQSSPIPLDAAGMEEMDMALKKDRVSFGLTGQARASWRVGVLVSVKFWTHLDCQLPFSRSNGSSIGLSCSSKSH